MEAIRAGAPRLDDVPAWLTPLVERALAPDPSARFPSVDAFRESLSGARATAELADWARSRGRDTRR